MAIPTIYVNDAGEYDGEAPWNSFQTLACFKTFMSARLGASVAAIALSDEEKARALITAYDIMQPLDWFGVRPYDEQVDAWPRIQVRDRQGRAHLDYTIPQNLLFGQSRIAIALLDGRLVVPGMASPAKVKTISADGASLSLAAPVVVDDGTAPASTDNPLLVCGAEMLLLIRGPHRTFKIGRA